MSCEKLEKIVHLLTRYKLQFSSKSELTHLECARCQSIIRDALQVPCGCKYCRQCLDALRKDGSEFCRGLSADCKEALLANSVPDYSTNQMISRLTVKCPMESCLHECALALVDDHLRTCSMRGVECPFHSFGCQGDKLTAHEMEAHFQQGHLSHSRILIDIITHINNGLTKLAHTDHTNKNQLESLEHDMVAKDNQLNLVLGEIRELRRENLAMKIEMQSMKDQAAEFKEQVGVLCAKVDQQDNDTGARGDPETDRATQAEHTIMPVNLHRDSVTSPCGASPLPITSEIQEGIDGANTDLDARISREVTRTLEDRLARQPGDMRHALDAYFVWTISADDMGLWQNSHTFLGVQSRLTYRLSMWNCDQQSRLQVILSLVHSDTDNEFQWPFKSTVTMVIANRSPLRSCKSASRRCEIERPLHQSFRYDHPFIFDYSDWLAANLNWEDGVTVTCIVCAD